VGELRIGRRATGESVQAWRGLEQTPRNVDDIGAVMAAADALLPDGFVMCLPDRALLFQRRRFWYRALEHVLPGEPARARTRTYGLSASVSYVTGSWDAPHVSQERAALATALTAAWEGPRHRVTRALLGAYHLAVSAMPFDDQNVWEKRIASGCRHLNRRLCVLAAARLDGVAHTVAAPLATDWPGSPLELAHTAQRIAAA
jgi:hypothetical protein